MLLASVPLFSLEIVREIGRVNTRTEEILNSTYDAAVLAGARTEGFFDSMRTLMAAAAQMASVESRDARTCPQQLRDLVSRFPDVSALSAFDAAGEPVCTSSVNPLVSIAGRDYFTEVSTRRDFYVSDYIISLTGLGGIVFLYPALTPAGEIDVIMRASITAEALSRIFDTGERELGGWTKLLDRKGIAVARWPDPQAWIGRDLSSTERAHAAFGTSNGVTRIQAPDVAEGEFAYAYTRLRSGYLVTRARPLTAPLAELRDAFAREALLTAALLLLATIAAVAAANQWVVRPVRVLGAAADAMAGGKLKTRAHGQTLPELDRLARQFTAMAEALEQREIHLEQALRDKELLMLEANHRVKNSLQMVAGVLTLHRSGADPKARAQFDDARQQVLTVARVHERLYKGASVETVDFGAFLRELCGDLHNALGSGNRTLVCYAEAIPLPTAVAIPVALIVNELVTNALKHSYGATDVGEIRVRCEVENGTLVLSVADDGQPLPPDFSLSGNAGLGLRMVDMLLRQLRGGLALSRPERGKVFLARIPLAQADPSFPQR